MKISGFVCDLCVTEVYGVGVMLMKSVGAKRKDLGRKWVRRGVWGCGCGKWIWEAGKCGWVLLIRGMDVMCVCVCGLVGGRLRLRNRG